jgi:ABC-type multidrug transport system fused ATPase/permease subunit
LFSINHFRELATTYLFLLGEDRKLIPQLMMSALVASALDVAGVGLILPFLTVATRPEAIHEIAWLKPIAHMAWSHGQLVMVFGIAFLFIFLVKSYVSARLHLFTAGFAYRQDTSKRVQLLSSFMFAPYEYHLNKDRASVVNSMVQNINKFSSSLLALLRMLSELVVVVFLVILIFVASPVVFYVLSSSISIILLLYMLLTRGETVKWGELQVASNQGMLKSIQESIEGLKEIRSLGVEASFINRLASAGKVAEQSSLGSARVSILPRYVLEGGFVSVMVLLVIILVNFEDNLSQLIPMLALLGLAGLRLLPSLNIIVISFSVVRFSYPAVKQVRDDLENTKPRPAELGSTTTGNEQFDILSLRNVSFSYAQSKREIFANISLDVNRQQSIGIIGGSGAGKTTLIDLILCLLAPTKGEILVNGQSITGNPKHWWKMVAYIPQIPFLSDDTIRRNIALGVDESRIDEQRINNAITSAQLGAFIDQLPDGKNTVIGDRGIRLSGGQRQRIAIARAIYYDRQVFIFDEATSALDAKTESEIVNAIEVLQHSKTMIIIAHRMSTLAHCDRILKISNGRIVEVAALTSP